MEEVPSLSEDYPKSDAHVVKSYPAKFMNIGKLRFAKKSSKQSHDEKNPPSDASADAPAVYVQEPNAKSLDAVEAFFKDITLTEDAPAIGLETGENRNVPCDASAVAPATQEPEFEGLHHVHDHSSTSRGLKPRQDDISTITSAEQLSKHKPKKSQLLKFLSSVKTSIKQKQKNKKESMAECKHVDETSSLVDHVVEERNIEERKIEAKEEGDCHQPISVVLSEEFLMLKDMLSELQVKINEINHKESNAFCYANDFLEWFPKCTGGEESTCTTKKSWMDSSSCADLSSTGKSCDESIAGATSTFSVISNGGLYTV